MSVRQNKFKNGDIVQFTDLYGPRPYMGVVVDDSKKNTVGIIWDREDFNRNDPNPGVVHNYTYCIREATEAEIKERLIKMLRT